MKTILNYDKKLTERAKYLRNNSTLSEIILWNYLKTFKSQGYDFHRQKLIDHFIVDFFCQKLMLAIEIDGESHDGKESDAGRQKRLESFGVKFLRVSDKDVKVNLENVILYIRNWIEENK